MGCCDLLQILGYDRGFLHWNVGVKDLKSYQGRGEIFLRSLKAIKEIHDYFWNQEVPLEEKQEPISSDVFEKLRSIISEKRTIEAGQIKPYSLLSDLAPDDEFLLIMHVQEVLDIDIPYTVEMDFQTVEDVVRYIQK